MMWKITRDIRAGAFGAGRALLLQIAHPWITRAIDEHSTVRNDPLERLRKQYGLHYGIFKQLTYQTLLPAAHIAGYFVPDAVLHNAVYHEAQARLKVERAGWFQRRMIKLLFRQERLVN